MRVMRNLFNRLWGAAGGGEEDSSDDDSEVEAELVRDAGDVD